MRAYFVQSTVLGTLQYMDSFNPYSQPQRQNRTLISPILQMGTENYGQKLINIVQEVINNENHANEKEMREGKVVVWGGFTNSKEKKRSKRQGRKGKIYPTECSVPENSKER